ncbi:MAG: (2Fe-2S)-binding protein, partial [Pirellulales bacterium]
WCRTYLPHLFEQRQGADTEPEPTAQDYARARAKYVRSGGGTPPPGATPIEAAEEEAGGEA